MTGDIEYQYCLEMVAYHGERLDSRNGPVKSYIELDSVTFNETPLVTLRKTAWKKALREMEWFLSGDPQCPEELMDWWEGQLNPDGCYLYGYGAQLRAFGKGMTGYDQIQALIDGIRAHPNSRRLLATTWNPYDMSHMTYANDNPDTPTTCHGTVIQAFVRRGTLSLTVYQRSADLLLGVPHNWIQYWGLLLWLCVQCDLRPGTLRWLWGDAHIYQHPTHLEVVEAILAVDPIICPNNPLYLDYRAPPGQPFRAADFVMVGEIPEPVTTIRPVRF